MNNVVASSREAIKVVRAATLQLATDDHLASGINSVNLEDRLGDVETDCRDRLHG